MIEIFGFLIRKKIQTEVIIPKSVPILEQTEPKISISHKNNEPQKSYI